MYMTGPSNYEKFPVLKVLGDGNPLYSGWGAIISEIKSAMDLSDRSAVVLTLDCYQGVSEDEVLNELITGISPSIVIRSEEFFKTEEEIQRMTFPDVTGDRLFGYRTRLTMDDFIDPDKLENINKILSSRRDGVALVYGPGAALVNNSGGISIYADMARWEIQKRFRKNLVDSLGLCDREEGFEPHYKRGWFVDWRVLDKHKKKILPGVDYIIDSNTGGKPVMICRNTLLRAINETVSRPFRMIPYFDPGPWGGKWMQEICDLDKSADNFAWCIDCVMEDQSIRLQIGDDSFEMPASNLAFYKPSELLGDPVFARFGDEFPIRFDFLDTMEGGNLSLQVHPVTGYAQDVFGVHYTQDESYYILDAGDDASVYLGTKDGIDSDKMIKELREAGDAGNGFNVPEYVNIWPAKKHDHFLIPGGTVHCSGKNSLVLEISSNPYMFTFKLWDWNRLGLDGKPRPINIEHGSNNIQWERTTGWVKDNLINRFEPTGRGHGWMEERTGLHEMQFIETRRTWFTRKYPGNTGGVSRGSCHVINLVEGREAVIESPAGLFPPFIIHYAETTVIPASAGEYTIRPHGEGEGAGCATMTAFVRTGLGN